MRFRQRGTLIATALAQGREPEEPRTPSPHYRRAALAEARKVLAAIGRRDLLDATHQLEEAWSC